MLELVIVLLPDFTTLEVLLEDCIVAHLFVYGLKLRVLRNLLQLRHLGLANRRYYLLLRQGLPLAHITLGLRYCREVPLNLCLVGEGLGQILHRVVAGLLHHS